MRGRSRRPQGPTPNTNNAQLSKKQEARSKKNEDEERKSDVHTFRKTEDEGRREDGRRKAEGEWKMEDRSKAKAKAEFPDLFIINTF